LIVVSGVLLDIIDDAPRARRTVMCPVDDDTAKTRDLTDANAGAADAAAGDVTAAAPTAGCGQQSNQGQKSYLP
jgi:hypothetical protein